MSEHTPFTERVRDDVPQSLFGLARGMIRQIQAHNGVQQYKIECKHKKKRTIKAEKKRA